MLQPGFFFSYMALSNLVLLPIIGNELLSLGIVEISTERDWWRLPETGGTVRDWRRQEETVRDWRRQPETGEDCQRPEETARNLSQRLPETGGDCQTGGDCKRLPETGGDCQRLEKTGGDCYDWRRLDESAKNWRRLEETERDSKTLPPPTDLCIKHQGWHEFTSTSTGTSQSRYGNVYYHCKPACV